MREYDLKQYGLQSVKDEYEKMMSPVQQFIREEERRRDQWHRAAGLDLQDSAARAISGQATKAVTEAAQAAASATAGIDFGVLNGCNAVNAGIADTMRQTLKDATSGYALKAGQYNMMDSLERQAITAASIGQTLGLTHGIGDTVERMIGADPDGIGLSLASVAAGQLLGHEKLNEMQSLCAAAAKMQCAIPESAVDTYRASLTAMTRFDVGQHLHTAGVLQAFIQNDWAGLQVRETQWAISLVERLQEQSRGMTGALRDLPLDWLRGAHERVKGAKSKARRKRRGASKNGVASGADARSNVTKSTDMPPVTAYEDAATEVLEKLWFDIGATVVIITALTQAGAKQCPKLPAYIRAELSVTATEDDAGGAAQWRQVPQFVQFMIEHKKVMGLR